MGDLVEFADLRLARARLDERELLLIEAARRRGATWEQVAGALELASRQAAQQRYRRLTDLTRAQRHRLDGEYSRAIAALRTAVEELGCRINADQGWDTRFIRAALVRRTVEAALDATPGSLYALAEHVAADLADVSTQKLPRPVLKVDSALRAALNAGSPAS